MKKYSIAALLLLSFSAFFAFLGTSDVTALNYGTSTSLGEFGTSLQTVFSGGGGSGWARAAASAIHSATGFSSGTVGSTIITSGYTNSGYAPKCSGLSDSDARKKGCNWGGHNDYVEIQYGSAWVDGYVTTVTSSSGKVCYFKSACENFLGCESGSSGGGWTPPDPTPDPDPPVVCDDCGYVNQTPPIVPPRRYDKPRPSDQSTSGYASAIASTPQASITSGSTKAKPGDSVSINVSAKAAYVSGYTSGARASVSNDLTAGTSPKSVTNSNTEVSIPISRTLTPHDVGKVFTGTASASPTSSVLTVGSPIMASQIIGYNPYNNNAVCIAAGKTGSVQCSWTAYSSVSEQYIRDWQTTHTQSGAATAQVQVEVPHNYKVTPGCEDDPSTPQDECDVTSNPPSLEACVSLVPPRCDPRGLGVRFAGEDYEFSNSVSVQAVNSGTNLGTYATNTRSSTYEIISFVIPPTGGQAKAGGTGTSKTASAPASGNSCNYYTSSVQLARGCVVVQRQDNVYFNTKDGKVSSTGTISNSAYNINGDPSSATSLGVNLTVDDLPVGSKFCVAISVWPASYTGLDKDFTGSTWAHGTPQCYTIAKKPTAQFQGATVYSAGPITTSQSLKNPSFTANSSNKGLSTTTEARHIFGTWSEYSLIANKTIKGMASGAAFGYNSTSSTSNGGNYLAQIGGLITTRTAAAGTTCLYSTQTFANATNNQCSSSDITLGNSQIVPNTDLTLDRIISRFSNAPCSSSISNITIGSTTNCLTVSEDDNIHHYTSGATTVTLSGATIPKGRTVTITVPGTLIIAGDIRYADTTYASIDELPQVIIFADDIQVEPGVSQIDAWLIIGQREPLGHTNTGVLNTCRGFTIGSSDANTCNNQLRVNGPVYASRLALNRTYGTETTSSTSSITPAEVFNLRTDSYLWAYAQARKHTQAVVTFTRELSPRY